MPRALVARRSTPYAAAPYDAEGKDADIKRFRRLCRYVRAEARDFATCRSDARGLFRFFAFYFLLFLMMHITLSPLFHIFTFFLYYYFLFALLRHLRPVAIIISSL